MVSVAEELKRILAQNSSLSEEPQPRAIGDGGAKNSDGAVPDEPKRSEPPKRTPNQRMRWVAIAAIVVIALAIPTYLLTRSSGKNKAAGSGGMGMTGARITGPFPHEGAEQMLDDVLPPESEQCMRYSGSEDVGNSTAQIQCTSVHGFDYSTLYLSFGSQMDLDEHYTHFSDTFNPAPGSCLSGVPSAFTNAVWEKLPLTGVTAKPTDPVSSAGSGRVICTQDTDGTLKLVWTNEKLNVLSVARGPKIVGNVATDSRNARTFLQWWSKEAGPCLEKCASGA